MVKFGLRFIGNGLNLVFPFEFKNLVPWLVDVSLNAFNYIMATKMKTVFFHMLFAIDKYGREQSAVL